MEQNADNSAPVTPVAPVVGNKQKSGNGLKITTVIACIVAICGIGFGVYGVMQISQKDSQISALNSEITTLKQTVKELENTIADINTNNTTPATNDSDIIINDWKLKIKIPESISNVTYNLESDHLLSITGTLSSDNQKSATVELIRTEKTAVESGNAQWTSLDEAAFVDDNFAYYLMYTSTMPERDLTTDKLIIDALSDSTLYSKI